MVETPTPNTRHPTSDMRKAPRGRRALGQQPKRIAVTRSWTFTSVLLTSVFCRRHSYTESTFDGTRKSKLTKPKTISSFVSLCVGRARRAAQDLWSRVRMPSHLVSSSLCAEESVVLIRRQTHITGTVRRHVNVPKCLCECVNVCVRDTRDHTLHV